MKVNTIEGYEAQKAEDEIFRQFKDFKTINDINKSFGIGA